MKITEIVALVATTSFVLTVAYTYGFSISIDVNLFIYFTLNDYIKQSVVWITPVLIMSSIFFVIFNIIIGKKSEIYEPKNVVRFTDMFDYWHYQLLAFFIILAVVSYLIPFLKHLFFLMLIAIGLFLWDRLIHWYLSYHSEHAEFLTYRQKFILRFVPLVVAFTCYYGLLSGEIALLRVNKHPTANIEMTSKEPIKSGRVLFALSQYIMFLEQKTETVDIIPVGQVKNIITIPKNKSKEKKNEKKLEETKKERKETIK